MRTTRLTWAAVAILTVAPAVYATATEDEPAIEAVATSVVSVSPVRQPAIEPVRVNGIIEVGPRGGAEFAGAVVLIGLLLREARRRQII